MHHYVVQICHQSHNSEPDKKYYITIEINEMEKLKNVINQLNIELHKNTTSQLLMLTVHHCLII